MPPKAKLHKDKGKLKTLPKCTPIILNEQNVTEATTSEVDMERQFEVELCWCIQQLQLALSTGKLNQKQVQDTTKSLNTLMSNSAPLIKKRHLMRNNFGDYRSKMAEEERKFSKINTQLKMVTIKPSVKSVFVKKAAILQSDKNFKFNFEVKPENEATKEISNLSLESVPKCENLKDYHYQPSNNAFRFNFS